MSKWFVSKTGLQGHRVLQHTEFSWKKVNVNVVMRTCDSKDEGCERVALNKTPCTHLLRADMEAGLTESTSYESQYYPSMFLSNNVKKFLANPVLVWTPPNMLCCPCSLVDDTKAPPLHGVKGKRRKRTDARRIASTGERSNDR